MPISGISGPSLASVIAFTLGESAESVARVERSASSRMARVRGWLGWRVKSVNLGPEEDGLVRVTVNAEPIGPGFRDNDLVLVFLNELTGQVRSQRLHAFLLACGMQEKIDNNCEVVGRYFATKNEGRSFTDFGPLTNALVSQ